MIKVNVDMTNCYIININMITAIIVTTAVQLYVYLYVYVMK